MSERAEIKIGGFGGQGVILSGIIIGKAAALYDGKHATLIQAFGPEARGSACSAQVVISDEYIGYPYIERPTCEVVMSQEAYQKFVPEMQGEGLLLVEKELVTPEGLPSGIRCVGIPAVRMAEELGHRIILNIVMLGFFTAMSGLITPEAARNAVKDTVPPGTESLNMDAFERGFAYGMEQRSSS